MRYIFTMAERVKLSVKIQPEYLDCIQRKKKDLVRSAGFIVEVALQEMFQNELPPYVHPGRPMDGGEDEE